MPITKGLFVGINYTGEHQSNISLRGAAEDALFLYSLFAGQCIGSSSKPSVDAKSAQAKQPNTHSGYPKEASSSLAKENSSNLRLLTDPEQHGSVGVLPGTYPSRVNSGS